MRGDAGEAFDPYGSSSEEPTGFAVAIWLGVAMLAFVLAAVAWEFGTPDVNMSTAADAEGFVVRAPVESAIGIAAPAETASASGLSDDLARLQVENAALRQTIDVMRGQIDGLSDRIALLEERLSDLTGTVPGADQPAMVQRSPVDMPTDGIIRQAPVEAHTLFGVEIGAFGDLAAARDAWRRVRREHPELFASLNGVATVRDKGGIVELLLVAGPFKNAYDAAALCGKLAGDDLPCLPAFYVGQPL